MNTDYSGMMRDLNAKNGNYQMVRLFRLIKVNQILQSFAGKKLTPLDERLLKGFYTRNHNELE